MRHFLIIALMALVTMGAACPTQVSDDPQIAMEQEWVKACKQMASGVRTAIALRKADKLSEREIQTMGYIKTVYVGVCTDEPQNVGAAIGKGAARQAVFSLCPELIWSNDVTITITLAAVCAGRQYLINELEDA